MKTNRLFVCLQRGQKNIIYTSNVRRFDSLDPRLKRAKATSRDENGVKTYFLGSLLNRITHCSLQY
jgi:hypothetical protein